MDRRDFLKQAALWALIGPELGVLARSELAFADGKKDQRKSRLLLVTPQLGPHFYERVDFKNLVAEDVPGGLAVYHVTGGKTDLFSCPISPHVFEQHPVDPGLVVGIAKWTKSAVVMRLRDGKVVKEITAPGDYRFFGHVDFADGGRKAYVSAHNHKAHQGGICIYNTEDWKLESIAPAFCNYPHQLVVSKQNQIIIGGRDVHHDQAKELNIIDGKSFALAKKFAPIAADSHILQLDDDNLVVSSGDNFSGVQIVVVNTKTSEMTDVHTMADFPKEQMNGEALSLAALSPHELAVSLDHSQRLLTWNLQTRKLQFIPFKGECLGVVKDGSELYVSTGGEGELDVFQINPQNPSRLGNLQRLGHVGNGRHMRLMTDPAWSSS